MTSPSAPTSRVVRVFISSTFRDFGEERDLLMKRVFPELRRRARDRFVEVIGVDLRWGITEEESEKGETLPICLREIERSRPYFVGLLGERYGWTPAAGQYPENLLAQQPWLAEHAGGRSVTELEILHGVLNAPEMAGRAYFYFRDAAWSEGKGADFRSEGADERAKLARLKERIRGSRFPVAEYPTPEAVADRITEDLWTLIDAEYPADAVPDELERERRSHEAYAHERRRLYVGQEETVAALLARLEEAIDAKASGEKGEEAARSRITLVTGESGTGKSALIANVLAKYRERHPSHVVIEHYIGSTTDASDPTKLMRRIAREIGKLTNSIREIEDAPGKLEEQFAEWLAEASWWAGRSGVKVVIALDALDKLSGDSRLRWLPKSTAPHLRVVLSSLASESREVLERRGVETLVAKPFTHDVARAYLVEALARRGRKLPAREIERIVAHPRATLPIYLRTLVEELSVFGSYEGLPQRIAECLAAEEPDDLFEVILARLESDLGEEQVRKPLEAIWASADGMSDEELIGFTGVSPLELARLKLSLDDALYESGGLVRLAHAYASKGVDDRYLPTVDVQRALHKRLGLWWEEREPTRRATREMAAACIGSFSATAARRLLELPSRSLPLLRWCEPSILLRLHEMACVTSNGAGVDSDWIAKSILENWALWQDELAAHPDSARMLQRLVDFLQLLELDTAVEVRINEVQLEFFAGRVEKEAAGSVHALPFCAAASSLVRAYLRAGNLENARAIAIEVLQFAEVESQGSSDRAWTLAYGQALFDVAATSRGWKVMWEGRRLRRRGMRLIGSLMEEEGLSEDELIVILRLLRDRVDWEIAVDGSAASELTRSLEIAARRFGQTRQADDGDWVIAEALLRRGYYWKVQWNHRAALDSLQEAAALMSNRMEQWEVAPSVYRSEYVRCLVLLGDSYRRKRRFDDAIGVLQSALRFLAAGEGGQRTRSVQSVTERDLTVQAQVGLAHCYLRKGDLERAGLSLEAVVSVLEAWLIEFPAQNPEFSSSRREIIRTACGLARRCSAKDAYRELGGRFRAEERGPLGSLALLAAPVVPAGILATADFGAYLSGLLVAAGIMTAIATGALARSSLGWLIHGSSAALLLLCVPASVVKQQPRPAQAILDIPILGSWITEVYGFLSSVSDASARAYIFTVGMAVIVGVPALGRARRRLEGLSPRPAPLVTPPQR